MEDKVTIEFTDEERSIICTALSYWSTECPYYEDKAIEIFKKIVNAH